LFTNSTAQISNINNNASPGNLQTNIQHQRTALWLRNDQLVTIAFHTLDGPTTVASGPKRHPKYCVCAGIDQSLYVPAPLASDDVTYQSVRDAVIFFAKNNQAIDRRIYIAVEQGNGPQNGDWIYPIYDCAIRTDIASGENETSRGFPEAYPQHTQRKRPRWPANLTTWKLKRWQDA
jgi:hypothetical protein